MLFTTRNDDFESEKERNLYYKFFAGYFFNELIPDAGSRLASFCTLLTNCTRGGKSISTKPIELTLEGTHVSFDNHGYLFRGIGTDRGEFADIFIHDRSKRVLIPIEAKVHSNWSYEKDILSNEKRLGLIEKEMSDIKIIPCLLVTSTKWEASSRQESNEHSNYQKMMESEDCRTRVIFWEELLDITTDDCVRVFVENQLARPKTGFDFTFHDNWFERIEDNRY